MPALDLRAQLPGELRRHPRVVFQGLFGDEADRQRLAAKVPPLVPFRGEYARAYWILDWDHRLPSRGLILRLYAYYTARAADAGERAFAERAAQIAAEELFPEFDVGDFAGLPADEAYEAEWDLNAQSLGKPRLVSEWRRQIEPAVARRAEAIARASEEFKRVSEPLKSRPPALGDLEAAEWSPPSENGRPRWTVEVWYLKTYNGMLGEGTAFEVDLEDARVTGQRDFQFRAG